LDQWNRHSLVPGDTQNPRGLARRGKRAHTSCCRTRAGQDFFKTLGRWFSSAMDPPKPPGRCSAKNRQGPIRRSGGPKKNTRPKKKARAGFHPRKAGAGTGGHLDDARSGGEFRDWGSGTRGSPISRAFHQPMTLGGVPFRDLPWEREPPEKLTPGWRRKVATSRAGNSGGRRFQQPTGARRGPPEGARKAG